MSRVTSTLLTLQLVVSFFFRNPNSQDHSHSKAEALLPASREKSRFRSLTWDQYDPVHQKYLEIGMKPKVKNHYRAHQLSVWLRLVPELHRAGMEDVEPRHNLFRGYADPSLYDGFVRPDPLSRINEASTPDPASNSLSRSRGLPPGKVAPNGSTESPIAVTTDYGGVTTCVSVMQSTNLHSVHNASTDTLASLDAAG